MRVRDRCAGRIERELAGDRLVYQDDGNQHHGRRDAGNDESNNAQSLSVSHDTVPYPLADSLSKHLLPEFFAAYFRMETIHPRVAQLQRG